MLKDHGVPKPLTSLLNIGAALMKATKAQRCSPIKSIHGNTRVKCSKEETQDHSSPFSRMNSVFGVEMINSMHMIVFQCRDGHVSNAKIDSKNAVPHFVGGVVSSLQPHLQPELHPELSLKLNQCCIQNCRQSCNQSYSRNCSQSFSQRRSQ